MWFDETRLDDDRALADADATLRELAESGARVRRALGDAAEDLAVAREVAGDPDRPRAVVVLGAGSDLVAARLDEHCGAPVVARTETELPSWAGGLDLLVLLAPEGAPDAAAARAAAGAVRRGCRVVAVCGPGSAVAEAAAGRWSAVLTTRAGEPLVLVLLALTHLAATGLAADPDPDAVAAALDEVATACSPYRDATVNPAKTAAAGLGDCVPAVLGADDALGARAASGVAAAMRRLTGMPVLAGDAADLLPLVESAPSRSIFDDPYDDAPGRVRPAVLVLGGPDAGPELRASAESRGVRVVDLPGPDDAGPLPSYAATVLLGTYAGAYLRLGLVDDPR